MRFRHRHLHGISVDRGGRRVNQPLDSIVHASFQDIEGSLEIDVKSRPRVVLAVQQPHRCQMNDAINSLHGIIEQIDVPDITALRVNVTTRILQAGS